MHANKNNLQCAFVICAALSPLWKWILWQSRSMLLLESGIWSWSNNTKHPCMRRASQRTPRNLHTLCAIIGSNDFPITIRSVFWGYLDRKPDSDIWRIYSYVANLRLPYASSPVTTLPNNKASKNSSLSGTANQSFFSCQKRGLCLFSTFEFDRAFVVFRN